MKKKAFKQLLSSIDESRAIYQLESNKAIMKARERVIMAAKRWRKSIEGQTFYEEVDYELDAVVKAIDTLANLESKHDIRDELEKAFKETVGNDTQPLGGRYDFFLAGAQWMAERCAIRAEQTPSNGRFAIDSKGKSGIIGGSTIANEIRQLAKELSCENPSN